jgi:hypothetical protein
MPSYIQVWGWPWRALLDPYALWVRSGPSFKLLNWDQAEILKDFLAHEPGSMLEEDDLFLRTVQYAFV